MFLIKLALNSNTGRERHHGMRFISLNELELNFISIQEDVDKLKELSFLKKIICFVLCKPLIRAGDSDTMQCHTKAER